MPNNANVTLHKIVSYGKRAGEERASAYRRHCMVSGNSRVSVIVVALRAPQKAQRDARNAKTSLKERRASGAASACGSVLLEQPAELRNAVVDGIRARRVGRLRCSWR
jgi:hypothetical protein